MAADEPASRMKRKVYDKELEKLQVQLLVISRRG
jgi:hypothetical protein